MELIRLFSLCKEARLSCSIEYRNGRYIDMNLVDDIANPKPETIIQEQDGFNVTVAGFCNADDNGEILYLTLEEAVSVGLELYQYAMENR